MLTLSVVSLLSGPSAHCKVASTLPSSTAASKLDAVAIAASGLRDSAAARNQPQNLACEQNVQPIHAALWVACCAKNCAAMSLQPSNIDVQYHVLAKLVRKVALLSGRTGSPSRRHFRPHGIEQALLIHPTFRASMTRCFLVAGRLYHLASCSTMVAQ